MTLSDAHIIPILFSDCSIRGHSYRYSKSHLESLSKLDLGLLLMKEYISYPLPTKETSLIPFNYCALGKEIPFLKPLLTPIC